MKITRLLNRILPWSGLRAKRSIVKGCRDTLLRDPTRHEIREWRREFPDLSTLRDRLKDLPEYRKIVLPVRNEVRSAYRMFHLREPTKEEIANHVNSLRKGNGTGEDLIAAVGSGEVRRLVDIRPLNLEMDITNQCNLRCVMCPFSQPSYYKRKTRHMPLDVFQKLADTVFHAVNCLSLAYGTESLLHPGFNRIITTASRYGINKLYINTNGLLLTEKHAERMVETGFHGLSISIDAATADTYGRIRKGGDFNRVLDNIRMVNRIRDEAGAMYPQVTLLFVLMRQNIHELPAFVDLARDLDAVCVNAMHMIPFKMLHNEDQTAIVDKIQCNEMLAEARERARDAGIQFTSPRKFDLENPQEEGGPVMEHERKKATQTPSNGDPAKDRDIDIRNRFCLNLDANWYERYGCPFPWHFMAIDAHGNVIPCGWWYDQEVMGNIYEHDLMEIWHNERYAALREELATGRLRESCNICPAAGIGDPNRNGSFSSR